MSSLVKPRDAEFYGDPRGGFFYPKLTLMMDSYIVYGPNHDIMVPYRIYVATLFTYMRVYLVGLEIYRFVLDSIYFLNAKMFGCRLGAPDVFWSGLDPNCLHW